LKFENFYRYTLLIPRKKEYKLTNLPLTSVRRSGSPCDESLRIGRPWAVAFGIGDGHGTSIGYNISCEKTSIDERNEFTSASLSILDVIN